VIVSAHGDGAMDPGDDEEFLLKRLKGVSYGHGKRGMGA
jgi:hypothetical protein